MHFILIFLLIILLLPSCANTETFVSGFSTDNTLSVDEKLIASNAEVIMLNSIEPCYSSEEWMESMTELIREAEDYILISTYLGSSSTELEPLYELLCEKAESGVDVYFLMDGSSSYDMTESRFYLTPLYFLKDRGVHVTEINPFTGTHLIAPHTLMNRDHRKFFIFDGKVAALGGMNLNYISLGGDGASQRDSMYIFPSKNLAKVLTDQFVASWNAESVESLDRSYFKSYEDEEPIGIKSYLFNQGSGGNAGVASMYASLINSAEEEILFLPYMPMLDGNMKEAMKRAKERGVRIDFVAAMDRDYVKAGVSYELSSLFDITTNLYTVISDIENGVLNLHEKLLVVDGRYTVIGSSNFNMRSMGLNSEICLVIDSTEFAEKQREHFFSRLEEGANLLSKDDAERIKREEGSYFSYLLSYFGG